MLSKPAPRDSIINFLFQLAVPLLMPQGSQTVSEDDLGTIIQINDLYFLCGCRKLSMFLQNCSWTNFILHQGFGITTHLFFQFCRMRKFVLKTFSNLFHYCTSVKLQHTRASRSLPLPITLKLSSMQIPHPISLRFPRGVRILSP